MEQVAGHTWWMGWIGVALLAGCSAPDEPPSPSPVSNQNHFPALVSTTHLPNVVQLHEKVISGGQPEGAAAFAELQELGVKTIISVDGATPDVATAREYGLRYVHLPHGYDGVPARRAKELAKAVRDLEGPIYIHCHHGKHRSPAAASVACVAAGFIPPEQAVTILELAGTSPNYQGLYRSAERSIPMQQTVLDEMQVEFNEVAQLPPLAEAMVAIEHTFDRLQQLAAANWQAVAAHPDLNAAHEALLLREHYTEMLRAEYLASQSVEFRQLLERCEATARDLEVALSTHESTGRDPTEFQRIERIVADIASGCQRCHQRFRDIPLVDEPQFGAR